MKMKLSKAIIVAVVTLLGLYLYQGGCTDRILEPGEAEDYPVYFWDALIFQTLG
jgi:hypothetical protein